MNAIGASWRDFARPLGKTKKKAHLFTAGCQKTPISLEDARQNYERHCRIRAKVFTPPEDEEQTLNAIGVS